MWCIMSETHKTRETDLVRLHRDCIRILRPDEILTPPAERTNFISTFDTIRIKDIDPELIARETERYLARMKNR